MKVAVALPFSKAALASDDEVVMSSEAMLSQLGTVIVTA